MNFVTKLSAFDDDFDVVEFFLVDRRDEQFFELNRSTGVLHWKIFPSNSSLVLKVAVADEFHSTKHDLIIFVDNFSRSSPQFAREKFVFPFADIVGPIEAMDPDRNDRIFYEVHGEPNGIEIDQSSALIRIDKKLFVDNEKSSIEFFVSATDRAEQKRFSIVEIIFPVRPTFASNLFFISLTLPLKIPSEIFSFHLVDRFHRRLDAANFSLEHDGLFRIEQNKLFLQRELNRSKIFYHRVEARWNHFRLETSVRIAIVERRIEFDEEFYQFHLDSSNRTPHQQIKTFQMFNVTLKLLATPLTRDRCIENFYFNKNILIFHPTSIRFRLCFFEIQASNRFDLTTRPVQIRFTHFQDKPRFSLANFHFSYRNNRSTYRVFPRSEHPLEFFSSPNRFGAKVDRLTGEIFFDDHLDSTRTFDQFHIDIFAVDQFNRLNASTTIFFHGNPFRSCSTSIVNISRTQIKQSSIPFAEFSLVPNAQFFIVTPDPFELFSIDERGKVFLRADRLNRTVENFFLLTFLIASSTLSYCQMEILIDRPNDGSRFVCPKVCFRISS